MKTTVFNSARELLDFLNPLDKQWHTGILFRSQYELDEAGYELLPSLFRPFSPGSLGDKYYQQAFQALGYRGEKEVNIRFQNLYQYKDIQRGMAINYMEQLILRDFVQKANYLGIHIPEAERMLNQELRHNEFVSGSNQYKLGLTNLGDQKYATPKNYVEIYLEQLGEIETQRPPLFSGLAQHHGAVTRLLDFSFHPYKSLFHVVNTPDAQKAYEIGQRGFVSIYWCSESFFSTNFLIEATRRALYGGAYISATYQLVRMPSSSNHYLHQQEGIFAYAAFPFDHMLLTGKFPSINDFLSSFPAGAAEPLQRAVIPISEFETLKELLSKIGITKSRLMPNLDNVVNEMR